MADFGSGLEKDDNGPEAEGDTSSIIGFLPKGEGRGESSRVCRPGQSPCRYLSCQRLAILGHRGNGWSRGSPGLADVEAEVWTIVVQACLLQLNLELELKPLDGRYFDRSHFRQGSWFAVLAVVKVVGAKPTLSPRWIAVLR